MHANFFKNLAEFTKRYPFDAKRLMADLYKDAEYRLRPEFKSEDPYPFMPKEIPPRVFVMGGIGDPRCLVDIASSPGLRKNCRVAIIVENNIDRIRAYFQQCDFSSVIADPFFEFIFMADDVQFQARLFSIFKKNSNAAVMESPVFSCAMDTTDVERRAYELLILQNYDKVVRHIYHNYGRIDDSCEGIRATLANFDRIQLAGGVRELEGTNTKPAVVVGAGPTLDALLPDLIKYRNRVTVIAVDAALKPLLAASIEPDYVCAIERENIWQVEFYTGLTPIKSELICFPVLHPKVIEAYESIGKVRYVYRNYSYFGYFERRWPRGILRCGGSAGHLAHRFAHYLGAPKVLLAGCDGCLESNPDGSDTYRSHCKGTAYEDWSRFKTLADIETKRGPTFTVLANSEKAVKTNQTYYQWIKEFSEEVLDLTKPVYNASLEGCKIADVPYRSIEDFVNAAY